MDAPAARRRLQVQPDSVPVLPRSAKLKFDDSRGRWVLLVPERVLAPDDTAVEVLRLCDGTHSVGTIIDTLAETYAADRQTIEADVIALLQDLADKGFLTQAQEKSP